MADRTYNSNTGKNYYVGDVVSIFFCVYLANLLLSGFSSHIANFFNCRIAIARIIGIIDGKPHQYEGTETCISHIEAI